MSFRFENTGDDSVCSGPFSFSPRDVAVITIISDHLLAPVRDMRTHGRQPFQGGEGLTDPAISGCIDDLAFLFQIMHPFLRK